MFLHMIFRLDYILFTPLVLFLPFGRYASISTRFYFWSFLVWDGYSRLNLQYISWWIFMKVWWCWQFILVLSSTWLIWFILYFSFIISHQFQWVNCCTFGRYFLFFCRLSLKNRLWWVDTNIIIHSCTNYWG